MPQGAYQTFERSADVRKRVRAELGIAPGVTVVLNAGFGDLRKGVDKFCAIAADMSAKIKARDARTATSRRTDPGARSQARQAASMRA